MIKLIKELLSVMNEGQKKKLIILQVMVIVSAIFEVVSVLSVGPFMAIVGNSQLIADNHIVNGLYLMSGASSEIDFLFIVGVIVLFFMVIAAICSIITIWKLSMFAADVGAEFGDRLYRHYLLMDYEYYTTINSAELVKKISTEVSRVTDNILQPLVQVNARMATIIFVSLFVLIYNPLVAIVGVSVLVTAYLILFSIVKNRLARNGILISEFSRKRFSLMNEGFGALKELQILGRQSYFIKEFKKSGKVFSESYGSSNGLYNMPRYFMELVVYSSMIALILVLIRTYDSDLSSVLPVLGVFGIAAFKLLPSFQQIYSGAAQVRSNLSAFNSLQDDLVKSMNGASEECKDRLDGGKLTGSVKVRNIFFKYVLSDKQIIDNLSLDIPYRKTIGIVGPSGSGKSTLLDILIGALNVEQGAIYVGGELLSGSNLAAWRNSIGYVSQMSLIKDGTLTENIAFGLTENEIDSEKLKFAADMAQLTDWISSIPEGFDTRVGEKGVQISGGQRQRIAIARALYNDAEYLFFDEATSALDGVTERQIMQSISKMVGLKTIVMIAHRLNTIKDCDVIYIVENGKLSGCGSYDELMITNATFRNMAGDKF